MLKLIAILVAGLVLEAVGVVLLSHGLHEIGEVKRMSASEIGRLIGRGATNRHILMGVAFEAAFFGTLLYLLSQRDVSLIWPLTALGFVITAVAARFIRHEEVSPLRWGGIALIVLGAMLVALSEKKKDGAGSGGSVSAIRPTRELAVAGATPQPGGSRPIACSAAIASAGEWNREISPARLRAFLAIASGRESSAH